ALGRREHLAHQVPGEEQRDERDAEDEPQGQVLARPEPRLDRAALLGKPADHRTSYVWEPPSTAPARGAQGAGTAEDTRAFGALTCNLGRSGRWGVVGATEDDLQGFIRRKHVATVRGLRNRLFRRAQDHLRLETDDRALPAVPQRDGHLRQVLQLPDQDGGHPAGRLPDLVRRLPNQPVERDRPIDQAYHTFVVQVEATRQGSSTSPAQTVSEPVDAIERGERIVDGRRDRPDRNLNELVDREAEILRQGPAGPDDVGAIQRLRDRRGGIDGPDPCEGLALNQEMAGTMEQLDRCLRGGRDLHQLLVPNALQETGGSRSDEPARIIQSGRRLTRLDVWIPRPGQHRRRLVLERVKRRPEISRDPSDDRGDLDRGRD